MDLKEYTSNLVPRVLIPICIALVFLLIIGIYAYEEQQANNLVRFVDSQAKIFSAELEGEINNMCRLD